MKKHFCVVKKISSNANEYVFPTIYNHASQNKRFSTSKSFKFFAGATWSMIHKN